MDSTDVPAPKWELARVALAHAPDRGGRSPAARLGHGRLRPDDDRRRARGRRRTRGALVEWAQQALVPSPTRVTGDPLRAAEIGDIAVPVDDAEFDVILPDVDNGPSFPQ